MKRLLGMPGTSPEPWGSPGQAPGTPGKAPGTPGTPMGPPGTSLRPPGDAPGTPRGPPGTPMDHENNHISTNIQRQKVSIAVFEPACWDPSHEGPSQADLSPRKKR